MPAHAREDLIDAGALLVPADEIAQGVGNLKTSNVVLLGALSARLAFAESCWTDAIEARVPAKTVDVNLDAFFAGRAFADSKGGDLS